MLLVLAGRQVIAVEPAAPLAREPRRERPAARAEDDPLKQKRHFGPRGITALAAIGGEDGLHVVP